MKAVSARCRVLSPVRLVLCLLALLPAGAAVAAIDGFVSIDSGPIVGARGDRNVMRFLGIPYAAPPVGSLRWRAPQPVTPWPNVRVADHFGPTCAQNVGGEGPNRPWTIEFNAHGFQSEDCLTLNVWTGAASATERRPVLVYVYGGGNREGSSDIPIYDGEGLAKQGIVVVTINYRLGILGFLAHPELSQEAEDHVSGNYGLMDQQAALRWVQRNIAAFGGDPARVTVGGQSAGAGDMHLLAISPTAKGLFRGLIAQSGSKAWNDLSLPNPMQWLALADAEAEGLKYAGAIGARSLAELRAMTWQQLLATRTSPPNRAVIGGRILPQGYLDTYAKGLQNDVPFVTGANLDEHGAEPHPKVDAAGFRKAVEDRFGAMAGEFLRAYPVATDADAPAMLNAVMRDYERASMYFWAVDRQKHSKTPAYTYYWTHSIPGPNEDRWGAFHCSEIPYFLNTLDRSPRPFTAKDRQIEARMSSYYLNFVMTGDPNGRGQPAWAPISAGKAETMDLGTRWQAIPVADPARFELLARFFQSQKAWR